MTHFNENSCGRVKQIVLWNLYQRNEEDLKLKAPKMGNEAKNKKKVPQRTRTRKRPEQTFPCALCPAILTDRNSMKYHACRKHSNFSLFECGYCQEKFNTFQNYEIKSHMKLKHKEQDGSVNWKKLKDYRSKFRNEIRELIEKCFPANDAVEAGKKKKRLRAGSEFKCSLCNFVCQRTSARKHACTHANLVIYECGYCPRKYNGLERSTQIKIHILNHHGRKANRNNFTDNKKKLTEEIDEWVEKCFANA
ncbi:unnamed protein product [Caenorhabditis brenneri]